ncbi:MAG TPA: catalase family peroxidase [Polyangiaceae bacterium]
MNSRTSRNISRSVCALGLAACETHTPPRTASPPDAVGRSASAARPAASSPGQPPSTERTLSPERGASADQAAPPTQRAAPSADPRQSDVTPDAVDAALEGAYGVHPGQRRNHAKGTCALGTFVGLGAGAVYSRSALFEGTTIPVVARFSLAGGNPTASDAERSPRGLGLEFRLPNGSLQHMTMINTPTFFAAMPRTFLDKMLAAKPDPATGKPNPEALKAFAVNHPENAGQASFLASHNPPTAYANSAYYGIHTFKFVDRRDKVTLVRWRFVPRDGEKQLSSEEMASAPPDFLERALIERTRRGPIRWDMLLTIGRSGDPEDDPTLPWPKDRKELPVGTLTLASATTQVGGGCEKINYDPLVLSDGIAATNDPVLLFRSSSYGASFSERLQGK